MLTKVVNISWIGLLISVLITTLANAQTDPGDINDASIQPQNVNQNFELDFSFEVGGGPVWLADEPNLVLSGETQFELEFDERYELPGDISSDDVLVQAQNPTDVEVSGTGNNQLIITSPVDSDPDGETFSIKILTSADLLHPAEDDDNYELQLETDNANTAGIGADEPPSGTITYDLDPSNTLITQPSVTPTPSVENERASYAIQFELGAAGRLPADSEITIEFPDAGSGGYDIPSGTIEGVTLNDNEVTAIGNADNSVSVFTDQELPNQAEVEILFSTEGTGIENPSQGTWNLDVYTETEQDPVTSSDILISPADELSFPSVIVEPDDANQTAEYDITVRTGEQGDLQAGQDRILLTFPEGTELNAASLTPDRITLTNEDGFSTSAHDVSVSGREVDITVGMSFDEESNIEIEIDQNAGIINPSEPDNYELKAETLDDQGSVINDETTSNSYSITPAPSSLDLVDVLNISNTEEFEENVDYDIQMRTGSSGRLLEGVNTISLRFPSGTGLADQQGNVDVQIPDFETGAQTGSGVSVTDLSLEDDGRTLTFTVPEDVATGEDIYFTVEDVDNPGTGIYTLDAETSAETGLIASESYEIGGDPIEIDNVDIDDQRVNTPSEYTIDFNEETTEFEGTEILTIRFPEGTLVSDELSTDDIDADLTSTSGNPPQLVDVEVDNNRRNVQLELFAEPGEIIGIPFPSSYQVEHVIFELSNDHSGVVNPSLPNTNYTLRVESSSDPNTAESEIFNFNPRGDAPDLNQVNISPSAAEIEDVRHEFTFTPGENGRLEGGTAFGSNVIDIRLPAEYESQDIIPDAISSGDVEIDGSTVADVEVGADNDDRLIRLTPADGQTIEAQTATDIIFSSDAGLETPELAPGETEENFTFQLRTDAEENFDSEDATISQDLDLSFTDISLGDLTANEQTSYNLDFRLGSDDGIDQGEPLTLEFPEHTFLPSEIATTRILVNGQQPPTPANRISDFTLEVDAPADLVPGEEVSLQFSSQAGILNPPEAGGDYRVELTLDESSDESPSYTILESTTSISPPEVELTSEVEDNPNEPEAVVDYEITFNTGSNGRLISGESTITLAFPNDNIFEEGDPEVELKSDNQSEELGTISPDDNQTLTVTVPEMVEIGNEDEVNLVVEGLTNPDTGVQPEEFTLQAQTSIEDEQVESDSYTIGDEDPVTINNVSLTGLGDGLADNEAIVNDTMRLQIDLDPNDMQNLEGDVVVIQFPQDTQFPSSPEGDIIELIDDNDQNATLSENDITLSQSKREISFNVPGGGIDPALGIATVIIKEDANIRNPREPGEYEVKVSTGQNPLPASEQVQFLPAGSEYLAEEEQDDISLISDTPLRVERNTFDPVETDIPVKWRFTFKTGELGRLRPQASTIDINFPEEEEDIGKCIAFTDDNISQSDIKIQGVGITDIDVNDTDLQITLTLAPGITVSSNSDIVVDIEEEAGIQYTDCSQSQSRYASQQQIQQNGDNDGFTLSTSSEPDGTDTSDSEPLPVEMKDFFVEPNTSGYASLQWITATERENDGFRVERRFSEEEDSDWEKLAFIESKAGGTTTEEQEYEYLDEELIGKAGEYKYRLVQEDFDGTESIYGPLKFEFEGPQEAELSQNYPNPFNPVTTIPYKVPEQTEVVIDVFNVLGKRVQTLVDDQKQPGTYTVDFDGSSLASGVYIVRMQAGGVSETMEITLVK